MSPEAMCRANKASFTLSFKIMDVASPVDQEIAHAIKHAGMRKRSPTKDLTLELVQHHSPSLRQR